ncbi:ABC transporter permease [Actinomadura sp. 6N118]|uniref:ABC transporter permease n=1 Tax=Actinomadura sp. 6N118 TaxID=3375151 RepID=UPI0037AC1277
MRSGTLVPRRSAHRATARPASSGGTRTRLLHTLRRPEFGALVGVITVYAFFVVAAGGKGFLSAGGTASWLNAAAELGVLAIPVGMLMIAGEFDLSVGSMVGASSMVVAIGSGTYTTPLWLSILLAIAIGAALGLVNGIVTIRTGLHSFIVTLASMLAVAGAALGLSRVITGTTSVSLTPWGSAKVVFGGSWDGFSVSILWWITVTAVVAWVLVKTAFGNWVFATGGDKDSARSAGVPTARVKIILFVTTGAAAALVGALQTVQFNGGDVTRGQSFVFNGIVAAVIGGVLLTGGYGSAFGVFLGAMTYGIVSLGIFYTGWSTDWVQLFLGLLLATAVLANNYFRKLALTS